MKILFLTRSKFPKVGGVEKHVLEVTNSLKNSGHKVQIISESDINYPKKKIIGLLYIWYWLFKNRHLIKENDIVHCHDVFIWYFPFRFLFPFKKVCTTFHGWEGEWPIPYKNILFKKLANTFSKRTISVGKYIEKYYQIKSDKIIYGGVNNVISTSKKQKNTIVWIGRLEKDTGVLDFLDWLKSHKDKKVSFLGNGVYKNECKKYGRVYGFVDTEKFLEKAEMCVPGGYLSYMDAISFGCKVVTFANNPLKIDYWNEIKKIKSFPSWDRVASEYIDLWNQ